MPDFTLSPQQQAVIDWVKNGSGSAFVEAVAGSGKTATLVESCPYMEGTVAFTAFNKSISVEIAEKVQHLENVQSGTFHSFGFGAWRQAIPGRCEVNQGEKRRRMLKECGVLPGLKPAIPRLVSLAKQSVVGKLWDVEDVEMWEGLIDHHDILFNVDEEEMAVVLGKRSTPQQATEFLIKYAARCVEWSREVGGTLIDFDDMIWLPLVEGVPIRQFDWVLVDEAQDTNPARRLLAARMLKKGGRSMWVGDRNQAIYGFTGASNDAVDQIVRDFGCTLLPLTVTFRCSKAATALAQKWVPHIEAAEANLEGSVERVGAYDFVQRHIRGQKTAQQLREPASGVLGITDVEAEAQRYEAAQLQPGDAILCRLNRPIVALAFHLIREGIGCYVEGRDIGRALGALIDKWKVDSLHALTVNLHGYLERETERLMAREQHTQAEALRDRVETLFVIMEGAEDIPEVRDRIAELFADSNGGPREAVVLSSVHKAKGREFVRVFILGFDAYMPSPWAKQEWEIEQEMNLMYVAVTRTKDALVLTATLEELE